MGLKFMKAIKSRGIITSFRGLNDGSLSLTVHTPELNPSDKAHFMELQGVNLDMLFDPIDYQVPEIEIDKDLEGKSQSERIRNCLYVLWKQEGEPGEFAQFYKNRTEKIINWLKRKLD